MQTEIWGCRNASGGVWRPKCFSGVWRHQCSKMYDGSNALKKYIHVFFQSVFYHSVFMQSVPDLASLRLGSTSQYTVLLLQTNKCNMPFDAYIWHDASCDTGTENSDGRHRAIKSEPVEVISPPPRITPLTFRDFCYKTDAAAKHCQRHNSPRVLTL